MQRLFEGKGPDIRAGGRSGRRPGPLIRLLILWGLFIVYGTTLPFDVSASREPVARKRRAFFTPTLARASKADLVSNVLLFLPWGGLLSGWLAGRGAGPVTALAAAAASGFALSGAVEAFQLFLPGRVSSWIDLVTNTLGAALGAPAGWYAARVARPALGPRLRREIARRPLAVLAVAVASALLLAGLTPFDISLDVGDLKAALEAARPVPFGPPWRGPAPPPEPWAWAAEALSWSLVGGLFALALREAGRDRPPARVIIPATALAGLLSLVIELAQVPIRSRVSDATSVLLGALGASVGAGLVARARRRPPRAWSGPALLVWGLAVLLISWAPPRFVARGWDDVSFGMLVPYYTYFRRTDLDALADILMETMRFLPLGALLAARSGRRPAWGAGLIGLGCGIILEAGQFFLEGRTADLTDALSAAVGAALGVALWRRGEAAWRRAAAGRTGAAPWRPGPPRPGSGPALGA